MPSFWFPSDDSFNFALGQPIDVDLTFWIVQGPVGTATFRINDGLAAADQIWEEEHRTVLCDFYLGAPDCPDLVQRIWSDGNLAPN